MTAQRKDHPAFAGEIDSNEKAASVPSRRNPPAHELQLPHSQREGWSKPGEISDELRAALWNVVRQALFSPSESSGAWTDAERPALRRVWTSPPLGADPARIPEDVAALLDGWFALVEATDACAFLESVLASLEAPKQDAFATSCNAVLEQARSDQRFVNRRLVPIPSRSDTATIERALTLCHALGPLAAEIEEHLIDAIDRLGLKPDPDRRGAAQAAIRAVEAAAFTLTGERHLSLDEAILDLEAKGLLDGALKVAYHGLFAYASGERLTSAEDARLILVMCASFVTHLASQMR